MALVLVCAALAGCTPSRPDGVSPGKSDVGSLDLVIAGGRVIDPESGLGGVRNVGIRCGEVAAITKTPLSGDAILDASGLVVAPGFIDLHAHG